MSRDEVRPLGVEGWNMTLLGFFGAGPKWTITCGECARPFEKRLDPASEVQRMFCPHCGTLNRFEVEFEYD